MHNTIIFNGITKPYLYLLRGGERPAWAPVENTILEIQGRPGGYISEIKKKVRVLNLVIGIKLPSGWTFEELKEDLAAWLVTDQVAELILSDEPKRVYYAKVEGTLNIDHLRRTGEGILTFICPDPYKYGEEKTVPIVNGLATILNKGTAESKPIIKLNVMKPITYADIVSKQGYMRLGKIPSVDDEVFNPRTTLINDQMTTVVGWSPTTFASDYGTITSDGVIQSDGSSMFPQSYGTTGSLLWHGPAVAKSLSEQVQDFDMRFRAHHVINQAQQNTIGRTDCYLLDVNKKPIARLSVVKDTNGYISTVEVRLIADNPANSIMLLRITRDQVPDWEHFTGFITLKREGQAISARGARTSGVGGRILQNFYSDPFVDGNNLYQRKVASVAISFTKYKDSPTLSLNRADELLFEKINQKQGIPNIAQPGNEIIMDCKTANITKNGDSFIKKTFGSSFPPLVPGENIFTFEPSDSLSGEIIYREAFK